MPSLRQRMLEDMQVRRLSPFTQRTYVETVARFARYFDRSPERLGPEHIRAYQVYLATERGLAASSLIVAVSALRFLYRVTLQKRWSFDDVIPAPKKPQSLPVVLSPQEVVRFLDAVRAAKHRAILTTCYAAGLRISEAIGLTVSAIDSERMVLRIAKGKGQKDRYVMLSPKLLAVLRAWWKVARPRHWLFCVFRRMWIADFGGSGSPVSVEVDHRFRRKWIAFGRSGSPGFGGCERSSVA